MFSWHHICPFKNSFILQKLISGYGIVANSVHNQYLSEVFVIFYLSINSGWINWNSEKTHELSPTVGKVSVICQEEHYGWERLNAASWICINGYQNNEKKVSEWTSYGLYIHFKWKFYSIKWKNNVGKGSNEEK